MVTNDSRNFLSASPDAYRVILRGIVDAWNAHELEQIVSFFAPDYEGVDVAQTTAVYGLEGVYASTRLYLDAFPDFHITQERAVIEGDNAVLVWTVCGTHRGKFMHIPPTGRFATVRGVSILTFMDGKIYRGQYMWDVAGLLRAIGLLPEL